MNDKHKNCPQEADKDRRGKAQENAELSKRITDRFVRNGVKTLFLDTAISQGNETLQDSAVRACTGTNLLAENELCCSSRPEGFSIPDAA